MNLLQYLTECDISVLNYIFNNRPQITLNLFKVLDCNFIGFKSNDSEIVLYGQDRKLQINPNSKAIVIDNSVLNYNPIEKYFDETELNINTTEDELFQLELSKPVIVQYFKLMKLLYSRGIELHIEYNINAIDYIIQELEKMK